MTAAGAITVKICGLSTEGTMDSALSAGADMVGLVFFPKSPRFVALEQARALAGRARGRADIVALTVDMDDAGIADIVATVQPDWIQLHGKETPERVAAIRATFGLRTIKALHVAEATDLAAAQDYSGIADRILLDAKPPKGAILPGGNGATFDWTILRDYAAPVPYLLSGGLDPTNVAEAIRVSGAVGVDVSSGVESAPGRKDPDLIRAFLAAVRHGAAADALQQRAAS